MRTGLQDRPSLDVIGAESGRMRQSVRTLDRLGGVASVHDPGSVPSYEHPATRSFEDEQCVTTGYWARSPSTRRGGEFCVPPGGEGRVLWK